MTIAGNGNMRCRKCGYDRPCSLNLMDAVSRLEISTTQEQREAAARTQFILCNNCLGELQANEVEFKVTDSKVYPVEVEFYSRFVRVVRQKIEAKVNYSHDAIEPEITREEPKGERSFGTKRVPQRIGTIDVPAV